MDERSIVRIQRDFSAGMFADMSKVTIPNNGVSNLTNVKNYGDRIEGRRGSRKWVNYNTYASSCIPTSGDVNASYYNKYLNRIFMLVNSDIYMSYDETATDWIKCICESFEKPDNSQSEFGEINNDLILFNSNGIYRLDSSTILNGYQFDDDILCSKQPRYYKINSEIPQTKIITNESEDSYEHRYIYSMSKFPSGLYGYEWEWDSGDQEYNESNITINTHATRQPKIDSGTTASISGITDYSTNYTASGVGAGSGTMISGLTVPTISGTTNQEQHWDCFSIWRTKDLGTNGADPFTGVGNNTDLFVWLGDVPVSQAVELTCTDTNTFSVTDFSQYYWLSNQHLGWLNQHDIESIIYIVSGSGCIPHQIDSVSANGTMSVSGTSITPGETTYAAFIGGENGGYITVSGGVVTPIDGGGFSVDDIGKTIRMFDGYTLHISGISGTSGLISETEQTYYGDKTGGDATEYTKYPACWGFNARNFYDDINDNTIDIRTASYPCYQRLYQNIPNSNIGVIVPGFLFSSMQDENHIYYSQIPNGFEYFTGYYHPLYQFTFVKDGIRSIKKMPDKVVVYSQNSTTVIPVNVTSSVSIDSLGVDITVIAGQTEIDNKIGVIADKSIQALEDGSHIMVTNEPAIRVFDGEGYSANLAYPFLSNILNDFGFNIFSVYNSVEGYTFWVNDESIHATPNRCFNFGLGNKDVGTTQGIGFSEIDGSYPMPYSNGIVNVIDRFNYNRTIVLDNTDDVFYDITTRACISSSYFDELAPAYLDKINVISGQDYGGTNIATEIVFKADTGERKNYIIESDFHNFYIDKVYGNDIDVTFTITLYATDQYRTGEGSQSISNTTNNKLPTVILDKKVEGNEIYTILSTDKSNFALFEREQHYIVKDILYNMENSAYGEYDHQTNLSDNMLLWWNINSSNPLKDRVSGLIISGLDLTGSEWYYGNYSGYGPLINGIDFSLYASGVVTLPQVLYSGNKTLVVAGFDYPPTCKINNGGQITLTEYEQLDSPINVWLYSCVSGSGTITIEPISAPTKECIDIRIYSEDIQEDLEYFCEDIKKRATNVFPIE